MAKKDEEIEEEDEPLQEDDAEHQPIQDRKNVV